MDAPGSLWYNARRPASIGLPAPVKSLLERIDKGILNGPNGSMRVPEGAKLPVSIGPLSRVHSGQRLFEGVSKEAWAKWLSHQTMLMNEYRLTPVDPKARKFLETEMEKFFFGTGSNKPEGYKPPEASS